MNWKATWQSLVEDHRVAASTLQPYRGILRLLRPRVIDRDTGRDYDAYEAANPLMKRFPRAEQARIRGEIRSEKEVIRREAGAVARFQARTVRAVVTRGREAIARARRDVLLSMPEALDGVTADGMIGLAHLEVALTLRLEAAPVAEKLDIAQGAYQRKDARGFVEATIIERLIATGAPLARDETEVSIARQLVEYVEGVQELRVPLDPETTLSAAQAYAHLLADMTAAGAASDEDDHKALRDELAS